VLGDNGVSLDLNEHVRVDQRRYLDHGRCGLDITEDLRVRPANRFPLRDIGDEDAGPNHASKACACLVQRFFDDFDAAPGLTVGITNGEHLPVFSD
jgi:hypothetical protein